MTALSEVDATVAVVEGRVAMSADVDARLRFETPDPAPLSAGERHATLRVATDGVRAEIDLDAQALDALADAVHHAQEQRR